MTSERDLHEDPPTFSSRGAGVPPSPILDDDMLTQPLSSAFPARSSSASLGNPLPLTGPWAVTLQLPPDTAGPLTLAAGPLSDSLFSSTSTSAKPPLPPPFPNSSTFFPSFQSNPFALPSTWDESDELPVFSALPFDLDSLASSPHVSHPVLFPTHSAGHSTFTLTPAAAAAAAPATTAAAAAAASSFFFGDYAAASAPPAVDRPIIEPAGPMELGLLPQHWGDITKHTITLNNEIKNLSIWKGDAERSIAALFGLLYELGFEQLNYQNVSAALTRLAKMLHACPQGFKALGSRTDDFYALLEATALRLPFTDARCSFNNFYSLGLLAKTRNTEGLFASPLMARLIKALCGRCAQVMDGLDPQNCSNLAWSLAHLPRALWADLDLPLFLRRAKEVLSTATVGPMDLSNTAWGLHKIGLLAPPSAPPDSDSPIRALACDLVVTIVERALDLTESGSLRDWTGGELANLLASVAKSGVLSGRAGLEAGLWRTLLKATRATRAKLSSVEASNLLSSLTETAAREPGVREEAFFVGFLDLLDERLADLCRTRAIETRNVCCALYCFARLAFLPRSALAHLLRLAASALVDGFSSREVFQLSYFLTAFLPTLQAGKLPEVIAASLRTNGGGGGGGNSGGGVDFAALISRLCKGTIGLMAGGTLDVAAAAGLCHCLFVIGEHRQLLFPGLFQWLLLPSQLPRLAPLQISQLLHVDTYARALGIPLPLSLAHILDRSLLTQFALGPPYPAEPPIQTQVRAALADLTDSGSGRRTLQVAPHGRAGLIDVDISIRCGDDRLALQVDGPSNFWSLADRGTFVYPNPPQGNGNGSGNGNGNGKLPAAPSSFLRLRTARGSFVGTVLHRNRVLVALGYKVASVPYYAWGRRRLDLEEEARGDEGGGNEGGVGGVDIDLEAGRSLLAALLVRAEVWDRSTLAGLPGLDTGLLERAADPALEPTLPVFLTNQPLHTPTVTPPLPAPLPSAKSESAATLQQHKLQPRGRGGGGAAPPATAAAAAGAGVAAAPALLAARSSKSATAAVSAGGKGRGGGRVSAPVVDRFAVLSSLGNVGGGGGAPSDDDDDANEASESERDVVKSSAASFSSAPAAPSLPSAHVAPPAASKPSSAKAQQRKPHHTSTQPLPSAGSSSNARVSRGKGKGSGSGSGSAQHESMHLHSHSHSSANGVARPGSLEAAAAALAAAPGFLVRSPLATWLRRSLRLRKVRSPLLWILCGLFLGLLGLVFVLVALDIAEDDRPWAADLTDEPYTYEPLGSPGERERALLRVLREAQRVMAADLDLPDEPAGNGG